MRRDRNCFVALGFAVSLCLVGKGVAQTLYVHAGAAGANNGSSWSDAYNSLQDALAHAAGSGGAVTEICVAAGRYMPDGGYEPVGGAHVPGSGDRLATFQLLNGVALYGGFAGGETMRSQRDIAANETILSGDLAADDALVPCTQDYPHCELFGLSCLDGGNCILRGNIGENTYQVVTSGGTDPSAVLDGFTITGGNANPQFIPVRQIGAGIYNEGGSPTISHCTIIANVARSEGGGMYSNGGDSTITHCVFAENWSGSNGAGMANVSSGPTVTSCTFIGNSGNSGGGMFNSDSSSPIIEACKFEHNIARSGNFGGGAGMYNSINSSPTINKTVFRRNSGYFDGGPFGCERGGGMLNRSNSNPIISDCLFEANSARYGGGMFNWEDCNPTVTDSAFIANWTTSRDGGGMYNTTSSSPLIMNTRFVGNSANWSGGGMYNVKDSNPLLISCSFIGNWARHHGGGIRNNSSPTIVNCVFSGNTAMLSGGGVQNVGLAPVIINSTFSNNYGGSSGGGGIRVTSEGSPVIGNCILWGNSDDSGSTESAQILVSSGQPIVNYSIVQGGWNGVGGMGTVDMDPLFVDPVGPDGIPGTEDDDLRLLPGSPAIDAGDNDAVPSGLVLDLNGDPRIVNDPFTPNTGNPGAAGPPIVDMGAFEYQAPDECDPGFFGKLCLECPGGAPNPCSGNGTCDDGGLGTGECTCNAGWTGLDCSERNLEDAEIPTVSHWGLVVMVLLLLVGAKIKGRCRVVGVS